jgi:hypothetical protein
MAILLIALVWLGVFCLLIAVHECGHYLAGWLCGIPRSEMRIRLLTFPQHIALRDGERWLAPMEITSYYPVMQRHLRTTTRLFLYTAGGMMFETLFTTAACAILLAVDWPKLAFVFAALSAWLWASYVLFMDLPQAIRHGYPAGDLSGMWWLAKLPTLVFAAAMMGIRVALLWATLAA